MFTHYTLEKGNKTWKHRVKYIDKINASQKKIPSPLGWNIRVTKRTEGGLLGYSSPKVRVSLKVPPSHGESSGLKQEQICLGIVIIEEYF